MCLRHSADNGRDPQTAMRVWQEARGLMDKGCFIFRSWRFPEDPSGKNFDGQKFSRLADFREAVFRGNTSFVGARFETASNFSGAEFKEDASFAFATFDMIAWFDRAKFHKLALFDKATCKGNMTFSECKFNEHAEFRYTFFGWFADFPGAVFAGPTDFRWASFQGPTDFLGADFHTSVKFEGATVRRGMDFHISLPSPEGKPFRNLEAGESAYRLAKQSATDRGDYRAAGEYHYAEQCAIEHGRRVRATSKPWRSAFRGRCKAMLYWFEFMFARYFFGYCEKPKRPLVVGIGVILVCALIYWIAGGVAPGGSVTTQPVEYQATPWECLYFSAVTFTTLGYGDYQPKPGCRLLAGIEAFAGAALMALFIVSLARKYTR